MRPPVEFQDREDYKARMNDLLEVDSRATVAITIDMQRDYLDPSVASAPVDAATADRVVARTAALLDFCRARGIPVVHAYVSRRRTETEHDFYNTPYGRASQRARMSQNPNGKADRGPDRLEGSPQAQVVPELVGDGDLHVVAKRAQDSFHLTERCGRHRPAQRVVARGGRVAERRGQGPVGERGPAAHPVVGEPGRRLRRAPRRHGRPRGRRAAPFALAAPLVARDGRGRRARHGTGGQRHHRRGRPQVAQPVRRARLPPAPDTGSGCGGAAPRGRRAGPGWRGRRHEHRGQQLGRARAAARPGGGSGPRRAGVGPPVSGALPPPVPRRTTCATSSATPSRPPSRSRR